MSHTTKHHPDECQICHDKGKWRWNEIVRLDMVLCNSCYNDFLSGKGGYLLGMM